MWSEKIEEATVLATHDFGARVRTSDGVEGFMPVPEIAYGIISHPSHILKDGDVVTVRRALNTDRVIFSRKATLPDPFLAFARAHAVGAEVEAQVFGTQRRGERGEGLLRLHIMLAAAVEGTADVPGCSIHPPWDIDDKISGVIQEIDEQERLVRLTLTSTVAAREYDQCEGDCGLKRS